MTDPAPQPTTPVPPRISLVIPAYNEEKYIAPTLESIDRARHRYEQHTGNRVEIIVVDNDSTDRTAEIARSFGCTVVHFDKHQIAAVRNAGARAASGEFIAFVDADRSIVPEDLFLEIDRKLSDPSVYGGGAHFRPEHWGFRIFVGVMAVNALSALLRISAVLFYLRRADFDALGGWNEKMYAAEDVDLAARMRRAAQVSRRKFVTLKSCVTICVRKLELVPMLGMIRGAWRMSRRRRDCTRAEDFHDIYYDVGKLR